MKPVNIFLLICGFLFCTYVERNKTEKIPSARSQSYKSSPFKNGDTLFPDYAHHDTLIVVNANGLNDAMEEQDPATDGEISDVLHDYCKLISDKTHYYRLWKKASH